MRIAVLAVVIIVVSFQGSPVAQDPAEMLTRLARPSRSERDTTLRRFRFVLPRLVRSCTDVTTETAASDMIAMTHRMLGDAGLEREDGGYLGIANSFHGMSSEVSTLTGGPFECAGLLAVYVTARHGGSPPETSRGAAVALYRVATRAESAPRRERTDAGPVTGTDARWVLRESEGNRYATVQGSNLLLSVSCVAVGGDPGHAIGILLLAGTFGDGTVDFLFDGEVLREDVAFDQTEPNVLMAWSARGAARTYNSAVEGLVDRIRRHSTVRVTVSTASGAGFTWDDLSLTGSNTAIDLMACGS